MSAAERLGALGVNLTFEEEEQAARDDERLTAVERRLAALASKSGRRTSFVRRLRAGSTLHAPSPRPRLEEAETLLRPLTRVQLALELAADAQISFNAFVEVLDVAALRRAALLQRSRRRHVSTLFGMPFAYKDVFASNSRAPQAGVGPDYGWSGPPSRTLARLASAGAVPVGITNLDPHCYAATGLNALQGRVRHPVDGRFVVGGSSGGSAVAVATGIVPFALGTDTGGSVRIPASLCGVYGFKPTHGLIRDAGVVPLSPSQDTVGILARSPSVIADVLAAVRTCWRTSVTSARPGWRGLRIGVDPVGLCAGMDDDVANALRKMLDRACALGASVWEVPFPNVDDLNDLASVVTGREAIQVHGVLFKERPDVYPPVVRRRLLSAALIDDRQYRIAQTLRGRLLRSVLHEGFARVDVILCPTLRCAASRVDHIEDDDVNEAGRISTEHLRLNRPFSYLGLPVISIPVGRDKNRISIGLQLVGRPYADNLLLQLAETWDELVQR